MNRISIALWLAGCLALAGCGSSGPKAAGAAPKVSLGQATAGDLTVEMLTDTQLETGMTPVYLKVTTTAGGQAVTDAAVTFTPLMTMSSGKQHSAPMISQPGLEPDGAYHCDVVFLMPSSSNGSWSASVGVTRPGLAEVTASFPTLLVADSGRLKVFKYTDPAGSTTTYVSSLNFEAAPKVGLNPVVVTLHQMQDMMTFPPVEDAALVLDPQMPTMGHGSPGTIQPVYDSLGRYQGQLSLSMPGPWEVTLTVSRGGVAVGAPVFDFTF